MSGLWLLAADFLDPDRGPKPTGDFEVDPTFLFAVLGLGFLIGVIGHLAESKLVIAIGIGLIFAATVALPLALNVAN